MGKYQRQHEPRSDRYSHANLSEYAIGRGDGLDDGQSLLIDPAVNKSVSGPLAGPSTIRAEAMETRALNMMAVPTVPIIKNTHQRAGGLGKNVRKGLSNLVSSIVGSSTNQRQREDVADMENNGLVKTYSDSSLVFVTGQDGAGSSASSPQLHSSPYQRGQFSTLGWQPECSPVECASNGIHQVPQLPRSCFKNGTGPLATGQRAMNLEPSLPIISHRQHAPRGATMQRQTQSPNHEQESNITSPSSLVRDEDICFLGLPAPMYEPTEYYSFDREYGRIIREPDLNEASFSGLSGELDSAGRWARSSPQDSPGSWENEWQDFDKESSVGDLSPPASLLIEVTSSLMEEPVIVDKVHKSPCSSLENSLASSGFSSTSGECFIPTIYPGMESYPPTANCDSEVSEDWCNNSRSLFDSDPEYHESVVQKPVHLRGEDHRRGKQKTLSAWHFSFGEKPVGNAEGGESHRILL